MDLTAGEPPQQERVDGAERELAALGGRARAPDGVEDPGDETADDVEEGFGAVSRIRSSAIVTSRIKMFCVG